MIYLQENNLLEYVDLKNRTLTVTDRYHELAADIKSAESRMAEIKVLQQHIINYSRTRSTYVQDPVRLNAIAVFDNAFFEKDPEVHRNIIDFVKSS